MRYATPFTSVDVDYDSKYLQEIEQHFSDEIAKDSITGAAFCMAIDGKKFVERSLGVADIGKRKAKLLAPNAIFEVGFLPTLLTSAMIYELIADGHISLYETLGNILGNEAVGSGRNVTIEELLGSIDNNHVTDDKENQSQVRIWSSILEGLQKSDDYWVKNGFKEIGTEVIGQNIPYSFAYSVLGEVISKVTRIPAIQYIKQELLTPCQMEDTCFVYDLTPMVADRIVIMNEETKELVRRLNTGVSIISSDLERRNSQIPDTGGFLLTTPSDVVRFGTMLLNCGVYHGKQILRETTIQSVIQLLGSGEYGFVWDEEEKEHIGHYNDCCKIAPLFVKDRYIEAPISKGMLYIDTSTKLVAAWMVTMDEEQIHEKKDSYNLYHVTDIMKLGVSHRRLARSHKYA